MAAAVDTKTAVLDGMAQLTAHMQAANTIATAGQWISKSDEFYGGTLHEHGDEFIRFARHHGYEAEVVNGQVGGVVMRLRKAPKRL